MYHLCHRKRSRCAFIRSRLFELPSRRTRSSDIVVSTVPDLALLNSAVGACFNLANDPVLSFFDYMNAAGSLALEISS